MKSEIGQNVLVDTKTGAGGFIANEALANAAPDGRTVGLAAMAAMCVSPVMPGLKLPMRDTGAIDKATRHILLTPFAPPVQPQG